MDAIDALALLAWTAFSLLIFWLDRRDAKRRAKEEGHA